MGWKGSGRPRKTRHEEVKLVTEERARTETNGNNYIRNFPIQNRAQLQIIRQFKV